MASSLSQFSKCLKGPLKGVILDITGVLYESGSSTAIEGSVEAINRLRHLGLPFRFLTNETQRTKSSLVKKLHSFGFSIKEDEVISPGTAACKIVKEKQLRPLLLVHPDILPEFETCDKSSPNCVVIGDAASHFTYDNVNRAFQLLISLKEPILISMGKGKYYKEDGELVLDVGAYTAALEYACGLEAIIVGKPDPQFFQSALSELGVKAEEAVMIGDDINSDIGAAQKIGLCGVLVKTGKFRPSDEHHQSVKPDVIVKNLAEFVDFLTTQPSLCTTTH